MLIRMQNNVPETYINQSRDFQLLCRMYDVVMNGVKFNIDNVGTITDDKYIQSKLLGLLQTKVGYFESAVTDDNLRYLLTSFPYIMKNKGSLKSIEQLINVYLKMNHISVPFQVWVDLAENSVRCIIKSGKVLDTSMIDGVMKYIVPTGFSIIYDFVVDLETEPVDIEMSETVTKYKLTAYNSIIRGDAVIPDDAENFANAVDNVDIVDDAMIGAIGNDIAGGSNSMNTANTNWGENQ